LTCLGNNILLGPNGAILNPDFKEKEAQALAKILGVPCERRTVMEIEAVGALGVIHGLRTREGRRSTTGSVTTTTTTRPTTTMTPTTTPMTTTTTMTTTMTMTMTIATKRTANNGLLYCY
jgi:hypothetical protein